MTFGELYRAPVMGELLTGALNPAFRKQWDMARADSFAIAM
jgi:hypothetical protein